MENEPENLFEELIVTDEALVDAIVNAIPCAAMSAEEFAQWLST